MAFFFTGTKRLGERVPDTMMSVVLVPLQVALRTMWLNDFVTHCVLHSKTELCGEIIHISIAWYDEISIEIGYNWKHMELLEVDGKQYVKARDAAKKAGYTADYVGQLCRSGSVDARLIGRSWYVDVEGLSAHRVEKKRNARVKAREQVKKTIAEQRDVQEKTSIEQARRVSYAPDERELLPIVKKDPGLVAEHGEAALDEAREPLVENTLPKVESEESLVRITRNNSTSFVDGKGSAKTNIEPIVLRKKLVGSTAEGKVETHSASMRQTTSAKERGTNKWIFRFFVLTSVVLVLASVVSVEVIWTVQVSDNAVHTETRYEFSIENIKNIFKYIDISFWQDKYKF